MNQELLPMAFFETKDNEIFFPLFKKVSYVWELIGLIPSFIESVFTPQILGEVEDGAWLEPNRVYLAPGAKVQRGAIVRGPTIIGPNTTIRSNAHIRGHVMIGRNCLIGSGTEVRQTILLNQSNLPHQNMIFCSFIGNDVNIGGGAHCVNKRLDGKEIVIRIDENGSLKSYSTGLDRCGAIVGDHCRLGGLCVLQPGTLLGQNCKVYPLLAIGGYISPNSTQKISNLH